MKIWRIGQSPFPVFDGTGAATHGGRWNPIGLPAIYCASSYALAMLEVLVHTGRRKLPPQLKWIEIDIPDDLQVEQVDANRLADWDVEGSRVAERSGGQWIASQRSVALSVPSVISPVDRNIIVSPLHPLFRRLSASEERAVMFDRRIEDMFGVVS
jgi:RES domain-containing protein